MRKTIVAFALPVMILIASSVIGADKHVKADLVSNGDSDVTGFVQIVQLPKGGSNLVVHARGLKEGTQYTSFYYESANCTEPADLLGNFVGNGNSEGEIQGKIDDDLDEVGSVSVRLGPGYGTLLACAKVH